MTLTESRVYLQLGDTRKDAIKATLTTKTTLGAFLKASQALRESDTAARAELARKTETLKGLMFLSPSGSLVYVLRPETRKIDGRAVKMLSIKRTVAISDVLDFEVAA